MTCIQLSSLVFRLNEPNHPIGPFMDNVLYVGSHMGETWENGGEWFWWLSEVGGKWSESSTVDLLAAELLCRWNAGANCIGNQWQEIGDQNISFCLRNAGAVTDGVCGKLAPMHWSLKGVFSTDYCSVTDSGRRMALGDATMGQFWQKLTE